MLEKITDLYQNLPDKKKYIDLVTAVLTIPVLLTVIISNLGNLNNNQNKKDTVSAQILQPAVEKIIIRDTSTPVPVSETPTPAILCDSSLPDIEIISPAENEKISADPVCITFNRPEKSNYCSYLHAYRLNGNSWSTYNDEPICLYNMASGDIKMEIKIKSSPTGEEKIFTRNFAYQNKSIQVQSSPSVQVQPSVTPIPTL